MAVCVVALMTVPGVSELAAQARRSDSVQKPSDVALNYVVAYLNWELARDAHPRDYLPDERPGVDQADFRWDPLSLQSVRIQPLDTLYLGSDTLFVFIGGLVQFHGIPQIVGVTRRLEVLPLFGFDTSMVDRLLRRYAGSDDRARRELASAVVWMENRAYRREPHVRVAHALGERPGAAPSCERDRCVLWSVDVEDGQPRVVHFFDFGDEPRYISLRVR